MFYFQLLLCISEVIEGHCYEEENKWICDEQAKSTKNYLVLYVRKKYPEIYLLRKIGTFRRWKSPSVGVE